MEIINPNLKSSVIFNHSYHVNKVLNVIELLMFIDTSSGRAVISYFVGICDLINDPIIAVEFPDNKSGFNDALHLYEKLVLLSGISNGKGG
ncbi:hypothetical protein ABQ397_11405 [Serratia fonticola]|uniref:hypothetical protein n=1 Tax=Serratia fonticola TaxID=47917 RepID=UPI003AAAFA3F